MAVLFLRYKRPTFFSSLVKQALCSIRERLCNVWWCTGGCLRDWATSLAAAALCSALSVLPVLLSFITAFLKGCDFQALVPLLLQMVALHQWFLSVRLVGPAVNSSTDLLSVWFHQHHFITCLDRLMSAYTPETLILFLFFSFFWSKRYFRTDNVSMHSRKTKGSGN